MTGHIIEVAGASFPIMPGDMVLTRCEGLLSRLIRWRPYHFGRDRWTGYSHAMGVDKTGAFVVSAESRGVVKKPLREYVDDPKVSLMIARLPLDHYDRGDSDAVRLGIAQELEKLVGRKYSYLGVIGYGLDTLISLGWRAHRNRFFAKLFSKADKGRVYCSEAYAHAMEKSLNYHFLRFKTLGRRTPPFATRPRDCEWTAAVEEWYVIMKTDHGKLAPDEVTELDQDKIFRHNLRNP